MDTHGLGEINKKTDDFKTRQCMAGYVESCPMHRNAKRRRKWAIEKPELENARQTRGIFHIEPEDEECKHENFRVKLEIPMAAAIPCKNTNKWPR